MFQVFVHIAQMSWRRIILITGTLFGLAFLIVLTNSNLTTQRFDALTDYLFLLTALVSIAIYANVIEPEDMALFEVSATQPRTLWRQVVPTLFFDFLMLGGLFFVTVLLGHWVFGERDGTKLGGTFVNLCVISLVFGAFSLFGTIAGRMTKMGYLMGLMAFLFSMIIKLPEAITAAAIHSIQPIHRDPSIWWGSRLFWASIGMAIMSSGLTMLNRTEYLLLGAINQKRPLNKRHAQRSRPSLAHGIPLPKLGSPLIVHAVVESYLIGRKGALPILLVTLAVVWSSLILLDSIQGIITLETAYSLVGEGITFLVIALWLAQPFILTDTIPADRRRGFDQVILSVLSPEMYLAGKVIGVAGAAILLVVVLSIVFLIGALLISLMVDSSQLGNILVLYGATISLGAVPSIIYISAFSVMNGALWWDHRYLGIVTGLIFSLFGLGITLVSPSANLIFPSGLMAFETIREWFFDAAHIHILSLDDSTLAAPFNRLLISLGLTLAQLYLFWEVAKRLFAWKAGRA